MAAGEQIIEHAHLRKQFAVLEGAGDPEPRHRMRRQAGDVAPAEADRACARAEIIRRSR
jgi:hypothetical protein